MNIFIRISLYLFSILFIFFYSLVKASPVLIDKIAVIMNDNIILKSDIDYIVDFINVENINFINNFRRDKLIEEIILKNILLEIGKEQNISVTENTIYKTIALHIKHMAERKHIPLHQFYYDFFAKYKWKYYLLYGQILHNLIINSVIINNIKNYVTITPYEITQQLKKPTNLISNSKIFITEMHVKHILLTNDKQIQKLNQIGLDINNRTINFYTAAHKSSEDFTSAAFKEGDLGWITPDMLGEPLGFILLNLNKNDISVPIFSQNSWHLIQLQETRKTNKTDILLKERALRILYQQKWNFEIQQWIRKQSENAYVKILDTEYKFH
ncbi:MAG: peptidylprolyl isomerase [Candidatus Dasytiphilus stammeri]